MILLFLAVTGGLLVPPQTMPHKPARTARLAASYERALDKLEPFNRQLNLDRTNVGAWGRINSTRDAARSAETPSLAPIPLSGW
jgi:hypothetical protein